MLTRQLVQAKNRRGVVLLMVLGLLTLFAAVGISFAMLAKNESISAVNFKRSTQAPAAVDLTPDQLRDLVRRAVNEVIYDTNNPQSAIRGHSLLRDLFGGVLADGEGSTASTPMPGNPGFYSPIDPKTWNRGIFNGTGIFNVYDFDGDGDVDQLDTRSCLSQMQVPATFFGPPGPPVAADPPLPFNFTVYDAIGGRPISPFVTGTTEFPQPERYRIAGNWHMFGFDEDYDAPDHNNLFLALERADGQVVQPSFYRGYLLWQMRQAGLFVDNDPIRSTGSGVTEEWLDRDNGRRAILRPRAWEYNAGIVFNDAARFATGWQDLLDLDNSGIVGDSPEELDVDTDGDGLKDAVWIDLGVPPYTANGVTFKTMFAFKISDLDGKINLNTAGKYLDPELAKDTTTFPPTYKRLELHNSNLGASPAEVNPKHGLLIRTELDPMSPNFGRIPNPIGTAAPEWLAPIPGPDPVTGGPVNRAFEFYEYRRLFTGSGNSGVRGKWHPTSALTTDTSLYTQDTIPTPMGNGFPDYIDMRGGITDNADSTNINDFRDIVRPTGYGTAAAGPAR